MIKPFQKHVYTCSIMFQGTHNLSTHVNIMFEYFNENGPNGPLVENEWKIQNIFVQNFTRFHYDMSNGLKQNRVISYFYTSSFRS